MSSLYSRRERELGVVLLMQKKIVVEVRGGAVLFEVNLLALNWTLVRWNMIWRVPVVYGWGSHMWHTLLTSLYE
jgi:hypothetical protein